MVRSSRVSLRALTTLGEHHADRSLDHHRMAGAEPARPYARRSIRVRPLPKKAARRHTKTERDSPPRAVALDLALLPPRSSGVALEVDDDARTGLGGPAGGAPTLKVVRARSVRHGANDSRAIRSAADVGDDDFGAEVKGEVSTVLAAAGRLGHSDPTGRSPASPGFISNGKITLSVPAHRWVQQYFRLHDSVDETVSRGLGVLRTGRQGVWWKTVRALLDFEGMGPTASSAATERPLIISECASRSSARTRAMSAPSPSRGCGGYSLYTPTPFSVSIHGRPSRSRADAGPNRARAPAPCARCSAALRQRSRPSPSETEEWFRREGCERMCDDPRQAS